MRPSRVGLYPLYGAEGTAHRLAPDWPREHFDYGYVATGVECAYPAFSEWQSLQPSETTNVDEWWDLESHLPPACLYITDLAITEEGTRPDAADRQGLQRSMNGVASDAIRALRLLRPGWFLDPALSEHVSSSVSDSGALSRHMGAYRLAFHDEDRSPMRGLPFQPYPIDADDFGTEPDSGTRLQGIYRQLRRHRSNAASSAEIALESFNRSFGWRLSMEQRFLLLFTALDAFFGGMRASKKSGGKSIPVPFRERAAAALTLAGAENCQPEAVWLDSEMRAARNAVAHGRPLPPENTTSDFERLHGLVRLLALHHLDFSVRWVEEPSSLEAVIGELGKSCVKSYNKCLALVASHGIDSAAGKWFGGAT